MAKLFVYGSLQQPKVQQSVIGRRVTSLPDRLRGFTKDTAVINGNTYPVALPSDQEHIDGRVLEVNSDELPKLDEYETDAYTRVKVRLESGKEAWVYTKPQS